MDNKNLKCPVAIIGTGNIGCDLLVKIMKSKYLDCVMFTGQREDSPGIAFAKNLKIPTSTKSAQVVVDSEAIVIFSATSAEAHKSYAPSFKNRFVIDLTPAKQLPMCVPAINLKEILNGKGCSLISCGAQAMFPTIAKLKNLKYVELVTTVASKSAGIGTRNNISEYLETTKKALEKFFKCKAKAILIINPQDINMHNTIYAKVKGKDEPLIIQKTVIGHNDYLPAYSGNLDCINIAAIKIAEEYVKNI